MKILITGGGGFIGSRLARALHARDPPFSTSSPARTWIGACAKHSRPSWRDRSAYRRSSELHLATTSGTCFRPC